MDNANKNSYLSASNPSLTRTPLTSGSFSIRNCTDGAWVNAELLNSLQHRIDSLQERLHPDMGVIKSDKASQGIPPKPEGLLRQLDDAISQSHTSLQRLSLSLDQLEQALFN